jgi:antirestriction protein
MARVHYWELSNYNNAVYVGKWFELDFKTYEDHLAELSDWLKEVTARFGRLAEEWIIGDVEDVPSQYVSEWSVYESFFEYQELLDNSGLDAEVFEAGIYCGIDAENIEDRYEGTFKSERDFAEHCVDSTGLLDGVPQYVANYFDYEAYGRDLVINDYTEHDGHYFRYA